ncbi:putative reverse transcriptase domain-containing protein, partial [Tanacetum coccineum]
WRGDEDGSSVGGCDEMVDSPENMEVPEINGVNVIASRQLVEIDKVIRGCKLEIEGHVFDINFIPVGSGSFDVIIRMDWLSDHKAEIICHEKVVRIPLLDGKVLRVLGEKPKEKMRHLISAKTKERTGNPGAMPLQSSHHLNKPLNWRVVGDKSKNWSGQNLKEHEDTRFGIELSRRRDYYAKFSKCEFWLQEVQFLRHVINGDGIHVDPSKIKAVKNWEGPRTPFEVRSTPHNCKANVVADALSRKKRVKPKRVRAMNMTLQSSINDKILAAQKEASDEFAGLQRGIDEKD